MINRLFISVLFTLLLLNVFSQNNDTLYTHIDTCSYKLELEKFYLFLSDNYEYYKNFNNIIYVSNLQNECERLKKIIQQKTKYIEKDIQLPIYISDGIFIYSSFDVGGRNYPPVYNKVVKLQKITIKIQSTENERKLKKLNFKLVSMIDNILNKE